MKKMHTTKVSAHYAEESKTLYLDMMKDFPIEDNSYSLIIADLSLHYFDNATTIHIMNEIKRD